MTNPSVLHLTVLAQALAIARLDASAQVPAWAWRGKLVCISRTPDELSVVCDDDAVPSGVKAARDWRVLKVEGPLELELTGVLAVLTQALAEQGIAVFAVSTFDTDYLLVPAGDLDRAVSALRGASFVVSDGVGNV